MSQGNCNCCDEPLCLAPTLYCETKVSTKTKCGYPEWITPSTPPKKYLVLTDRSRSQANDSSTVDYNDSSISYHYNTIQGRVYDNDRTSTTTYTSLTCISNVALTGTITDHTFCSIDTNSGSCSIGRDCVYTFDYATNIGNYVGDCGGGNAGTCVSGNCPVGACSCANGTAVCSNTSGNPPPTITQTDKTTTTFTQANCDDVYSAGTNHWSYHSSYHTEYLRTETLSSEYTTAQLKTNTVTALPATFTNSGVCYAFADLSVDETTYAIRRLQYQLRHYPTASCYLKVWLQKRFRAKGAAPSADILIPLTDYVWTGSGTPCLTNTTQAFNSLGNRIENAFAAENEPATNGTMFIEIKKWSCLLGYTPADPNLDGSRPNPDPNPNGWPKPA